MSMVCLAPIPAEGLIVLAMVGVAWVYHRLRRCRTSVCAWFGEPCPHDETCPLWLRHCPGLESGMRGE